MSFFAILCALLIEQVRPLGFHNPVYGAVLAWTRWTSRNFDAGKPHHGWVAWLLAVGVPSLLALGIHWLLLLTLPTSHPLPRLLPLTLPISHRLPRLLPLTLPISHPLPRLLPLTLPASHPLPQRVVHLSM